MSPGRPSNRALLARELGHQVGLGAAPEDVATNHFMFLHEFVALRIEHHEYYDAGLLQGRGEAELERQLEEFGEKNRRVLREIAQGMGVPRDVLEGS